MKPHKIKKICIQCGVEFIRVYCLGKTQKFCSQKCHGIYQSGNRHPMSGKKHTIESIEKMRLSHKGQPAWNKGIKGFCKVWNKGLKGAYHHSLETRKKISEHNANKKNIGEKNRFWKGGITPLRKLIHKLPKYKEWRILIFRRDGYKCICGNVGDIEAHHKKEFYKIFKEFLIEYSQFSPIEDKNTLIRLAISYKPFWDLNNGETLCDDCHIKTYMGRPCH